MRTKAFVSMRALPAVARLIFHWDIGSADVPRRLEPLGELIIGLIVETTVLAVVVFMIVTLACVGLL